MYIYIYAYIYTFEHTLYFYSILAELRCWLCSEGLDNRKKHKASKSDKSTPGTSEAGRHLYVYIYIHINIYIYIHA